MELIENSRQGVITSFDLVNMNLAKSHIVYKMFFPGAMDLFNYKAADTKSLLVTSRILLKIPLLLTYQDVDFCLKQLSMYPWFSRYTLNAASVEFTIYLKCMVCIGFLFLEKKHNKLICCASHTFVDQPRSFFLIEHNFCLPKIRMFRYFPLVMFHTWDENHGFDSLRKPIIVKHSKEKNVSLYRCI